MTEFLARNLAEWLAALGAGGLICALFYPGLGRQTATVRPDRVLAAVRKPLSGEAPATRTVRTAHENALKAVAEHRRSRRAPRLGGQLTAAGLQWPQQRFIVCCVLFGAVLFAGAALAGAPKLIALGVAMAGGWLLPLRVLEMLARRRRETFLCGFTSAVDMIVRGTRSGLAVTDCLNMAAAEGNPLVRGEFAAIAAQLRAGVPLSEAMARLSTAMPVPEVRFFVLVMSMQSQTGGNLSNALDNLAKMLRDRQRLAAKVRTASAEVKASAITVGALPFVVIGATALLSPDYIRILWTDEAGRKILMFSAVWLAIGVWVLRRMARIEV